MEIQSTRFGTLDIDPETVIEFPRGLPGFEQDRRFKLLHTSETPTVYYLQSLDDADVALPVTDPGEVGVVYEFSLDDEESALLALDDPGQALVLMVLYRDGEGDGEPLEQAGGGRVRGNLYAPLVINTVRRSGLQKVLQRPRHATLIREI